MPGVFTTCAKCSAQFSWNPDFQDMPNCPNCGYNPNQAYRSADIRKLVKMLKSSDSGKRNHAAAELGKRGDRAAVEPLIAALKDREPIVVLPATIALGKLRDRRAVAPLLSVMRRGPEYGPSGSAAEALVKIGTREAIHAVTANLECVDPMSLRDVIAELVDRKKLAFQGLLKALDSDTAYVRREVVSALAEIGDSRALPRLQSLLNDTDEHVRERAADACAALGLDNSKRDDRFKILYKRDDEPAIAWLGSRSTGLPDSDDQALLKLIVTSRRIHSWVNVTLGQVQLRTISAIMVGPFRSPELEGVPPMPFRDDEMIYPPGDRAHWRAIHIIGDDENDRIDDPEHKFLRAGLWHSALVAGGTLVGYADRLYVVPHDRLEDLAARIKKAGPGAFDDYPSFDDPTLRYTDSQGLIREPGAPQGQSTAVTSNTPDTAPDTVEPAYSAEPHFDDGGAWFLLPRKSARKVGPLTTEALMEYVTTHVCGQGMCIRSEAESSWTAWVNVPSDYPELVEAGVTDVVHFAAGTKHDQNASRQRQRAKKPQQSASHIPDRKCSQCNKALTDSDAACPHCGHMEWSFVVGTGVVAAVLLAVGMLVCAPGVWRWLWTGLGGLIAFVIAVVALDALATIRKVARAAQTAKDEDTAEEPNEGSSAAETSDLAVAEGDKIPQAVAAAPERVPNPAAGASPKEIARRLCSTIDEQARGHLRAGRKAEAIRIYNEAGGMSRADAERHVGTIIAQDRGDHRHPDEQAVDEAMTRLYQA